MRGAKQVQMSRSPITFFAIVLVVSLCRISFISHRITLRLGIVVFARIKNVYIAFQRVKVNMSSSFSFVAGAGIVRFIGIYRRDRLSSQSMFGLCACLRSQNVGAPTVHIMPLEEDEGRLIFGFYCE